MADIMQQNCDNVAKNNLIILAGSNLTGGLLGAGAFYKLSKSKKNRTLKAVGVGLLSSFITGVAVSNLYLKNKEKSKECLPYWTQLPEKKGTLIDVKKTDY